LKKFFSIPILTNWPASTHLYSELQKKSNLPHYTNFIRSFTVNFKPHNGLAGIFRLTVAGPTLVLARIRPRARSDILHFAQILGACRARFMPLRENSLQILPLQEHVGGVERFRTGSKLHRGVPILAKYQPCSINLPRFKLIFFIKSQLTRKTAIGSRAIRSAFNRWCTVGIYL
jgi:hypothetical protein